MQVCKYTSMQVCKYAVCKYAGMQVYNYGNMQVCRFASMRVYKHASLEYKKGKKDGIQNLITKKRILRRTPVWLCSAQFICKFVNPTF